MADDDGGDESVDRADGCVGGGLPKTRELTVVTELLRELTAVSEVDCQSGQR